MRIIPALALAIALMVLATPAPAAERDELFDALKSAPNEAAGRAVEHAIWEFWMAAGPTAEVRARLRDAIRAIHGYEIERALGLLDEIVANFDLLEEWDDRYRYVIELGRTLEPLSEAEHSAENKVQGCVSQVWLSKRVERDGNGEPRLIYLGDSDAHIVRGLVAIVLTLFSGQTPQHILATDALTQADGGPVEETDLDEVVLAALDQAGVNPKDVNLIDLQPQASLAAWQRGDVDAVYTWLPTLDELRQDGTTLIASRQLATAGKPTLDLGVVSSEFATANPEVVNTWRQVQARALTLIKDDPQAAADAVAAQLGTTPEDAANQLRQGTFLTVAELTSPTWLGTQGNPGNLSENLHSAAVFLAEQQQIPAAPPIETFREAIYTEGLPGVLEQQ